MSLSAPTLLAPSASLRVKSRRKSSAPQPPKNIPLAAAFAPPQPTEQAAQAASPPKGKERDTGAPSPPKAMERETGALEKEGGDIKDASKRVRRRVRRGMRNEALHPRPPPALPPLSSLNSAFQLQEHLSHLISYRGPHALDEIVDLPSDADRDVWVFEQLRRLGRDLNAPWVAQLQEVCSRESCPEMKAGEWLYLCVAHEGNTSTSCAAIDYIHHTLDGATALLNNPRVFPSRLSIPQPSVRNFSAIARRLSRIFAHAYFHHREVFTACEAESSLYARFLRLSETYSLVPLDLLFVPPAPSATADAEPSSPKNLSETSASSEYPTDAADPIPRRRITSMLPRQLADVGPIAKEEDAESSDEERG